MDSSAVSTSQQAGQRIYTVTFVLVAALVAIFACAYGILEPDSWAFLELAKSLQRGAGCSVDGSYIAVEACGYPVLIALTDKLSGLGDLIIASKLVNLLLLLSGFVLILKTIKNLPLSALFFINAPMFYVYTFTLSEIVTVFAFCGALFCLSRIRSASSAKLDVVWLTLFLLTGCSARYFFGPFCAVIWLAALLVFGRTVAFKALPAFIVTAAAYFAYQQYNLIHTGFPTGMPRMPSAESAGYLITAFVTRVGFAFLIIFFTTFLYRIIAGQGWKVLRLEALRTSLVDRSGNLAVYKFLFLTGCGFLLLTFTLRFLFHFDLFDFRIIGFGVVMISVALLGLGNRPQLQSNWVRESIALVVLGFAAVFLSQNFSVWKDAFSAPYQTPQSYIASAHSPLHNKIIFTFGMPQKSKLIIRSREYYDENSKILSVYRAAASRPDTLSSLASRLKKLEDEDCVFDFTVYENLDDFKTNVLDASYPVALDFSQSMFKPARVLAKSFDPEVAIFLSKIYRPKSAVSCNDVLRSLQETIGADAK